MVKEKCLVGIVLILWYLQVNYEGKQFEFDYSESNSQSPHHQPHIVSHTVCRNNGPSPDNDIGFRHFRHLYHAKTQHVKEESMAVFTYFKDGGHWNLFV